MTAWTMLLDRLERQISRQETALREGRPPPDALRLDHPPTDPMSTEELVRATALMQRNDALLDDTITALAARPRARTSPYA